MERKINVESSITLALLYNYRATKRKSLPYNNVIEFDLELNEKLNEMNTLVNNSISQIPYIKNSDENKHITFVLKDGIDINKLEAECLLLSKDVYIASMKDEVLNTIGLLNVDGNLIAVGCDLDKKVK